MWKTYKLLLKPALNHSSLPPPVMDEEDTPLTLAMIDSDINDLILDYLTAEGYATAAEKFSKEANLKPLEQQESVIRRHKIKHDIHLGSIQNAIEAINQLNPQVSHIIPCSPSFICYDYICFMHHAYSLRVVDEK
jgi:hypothetical protein